MSKSILSRGRPFYEIWQNVTAFVTCAASYDMRIDQKEPHM